MRTPTHGRLPLMVGGAQPRVLGIAARFADTTDAIIERLLAHRERHGVTSFVLPSHAADAMRPVLARLT